MEKSNTQKIRLGLFIIISTFLLVTALYIIGNRQNLLGKTFEISTVFNNVNGLQLGNNVRFSGINVGTVKKIVMINDTTVCVNMVIEEEMLEHLKKNAVATIGSDGLVGSMIINIIPDKYGAQPIQHGDTIRSFSRISTNDMLTTLNTTNENAALLTSDLLKITRTINSSKGTLGLLINDPGMATNLQETLVNLKNASSGAVKTITKLNTIIDAVNYDESLAGVILSDTVAAGKMRSIIGHLDDSSLGVDSLITNLTALVESIKDSEGVLKFVLTDTVFVRNLDETMENIKTGSIKLNEDLEALKHNFLLRRYFKKLEKQQAKQQ